MRLSVLLICLVVISLCNHIIGQDLAFVPVEHTGLSGFRSLDPMAISDMNDDLLDDIIILDRGRHLYIAYQQLHGLGFIIDTLGVSLARSQWNMAIGDMNNDGIRDIVTVGNKDHISIIYRYSDSTRVQAIPNSKVYSQSLNLVDTDHDGHLDIFITDDENRNRLYLNDRNGNWVYKPNIFGEIEDQNISSGNYGSAWEDFDDDGDIDLYVSKCKGGVDDPNDPRRQNKLFRQKEDGSFEEVAGLLGLDFGNQSWTSNFGDLDNDGDMDLLVTNHDSKAIILENDHGVFVDKTITSQLAIEGAVIESILEDFDNDGFLDVFIGGSPSYLYHNRGDWTFKSLKVPTDIYDIISFAIGDLNNDGFQDIYASFPALLNESSSPLTDKVFINKTNNNHYIKFKLQSASKNIDAIGARIQLFYKDNSPIKSIRAGESYGIMHSMNVHFGLGQAESIDSVLIYWPSGNKTKHIIGDIDKIYVISEFECISTPELINSISHYNICRDDSILLGVNSGTNHIWNNGQRGHRIVVKESGTYVVSYLDAFDCKKYSSPITVSVDENESPTIQFLQGDLLNCQGTSVTLKANKEDVTWHVNDDSYNTDEIRISNRSTVFCVFDGTCAEYSSDTMTINFLESIEPPVAYYKPIRKNETTYVHTDSDSVHWYIDPFIETHFSSNDTIHIGPLNKDTVVFVSAISNNTFSKDTFGPTFNQLKDGGYHSDRLNAETYFNVYKDIHLYNLEVYTEESGDREINIIDPNGNLLFAKNYYLDSGYHVLEINIDIKAQEGSFIIKTNELINNRELGNNSPRLWRTKQPYGYPYSYYDRMRISKSSLGVHNSYYFYNWVISHALHNCESERTQVEIKLDSITSTDQIFKGFSSKIYPNPGFVDKLAIQLNDNSGGALSIIVFSAIGEVQLEQHYPSTAKNSTFWIDISNLQPGTYIVKITDLVSGQHELSLLNRLN